MQESPLAVGYDRPAQQFCGHADTTFPSGSVMTRRSPAREPSLARLASAVTVLPTAASTSLRLIFRTRKKLGGGPSSDQLATWSPPPFVSTTNSMCGFLQSTFVSVPVTVIRSLKSNSADML